MYRRSEGIVKDELFGRLGDGVREPQPARIQLELKDNTVSVVVDERAIAKATVGDNDYQLLLAYVRQSR